MIVIGEALSLTVMDESVFAFTSACSLSRLDAILAAVSVTASESVAFLLGDLRAMASVAVSLSTFSVYALVIAASASAWFVTPVVPETVIGFLSLTVIAVTVLALTAAWILSRLAVIFAAVSVTVSLLRFRFLFKSKLKFELTLIKRRVPTFGI